MVQRSRTTLREEDREKKKLEEGVMSVKVVCDEHFLSQIPRRQSVFFT